MSDRTVILSDTHLGRPRGAVPSADALRPLWQGATDLIINGDIAEVHHPRYRGNAARHVLRLAELCETDGVRLVLLSGNHDPFLSDVRHLLLAGGDVFVTHGDVLHPAIAPWSPRAGRMRQAHNSYLEQVAPEDRGHLESMLAVSQHASHAEWEALAQQARKSKRRSMLLRPWKVAQVLWYWHRFPRLAARFLETHAPESRFGIFGHTHHPQISTINGRTIINTGCYGFPGSPRAVTIENSVLTVRNINTTAREFSFATQQIATFEIAQPTKPPNRAMATPTTATLAAK